MIEDASIEPRLLKRQYMLTATTAATTFVDYVVPQGRAMMVIWAAGVHNDGSARVCQFVLIDALSGLNTALEVGTSRAAATQHQLYDTCKAGCCLLLRAGHTLRFYVPAAAGGTTITLFLWIEEIRGEDNYGA